MNMPKSLAATEVGETVRVVSLLAEGRMRRRLADLGLIPGAEVTCLGRSPLGDPSAYLIRGAVIAIRRRDAMEVSVTTE
ncbi:MAG: FeoA family protein [Eubacteriales bacterium]|nr:FeoA family protein [Eubacteriales bacterium]